MNRRHVSYVIGIMILLFAAILAVKASRTSTSARGENHSRGEAASAGKSPDTQHVEARKFRISKQPDREDLGEPIRMEAFWDEIGGPVHFDSKLITASYLSRLDFPNPHTLNKEELTKFRRIIMLIGDCVHIEATARFAFIRDNVPADWLETTADDMLRFLSIEDLHRVLVLIDELPGGEPKCDMYRLAAQRMVRLEIPREEIEDWIRTLESDDEREEATLMLH